MQASAAGDMVRWASNLAVAGATPSAVMHCAATCHTVHPDVWRHSSLKFVWLWSLQAQAGNWEMDRPLTSSLSPHSIPFLASHRYLQVFSGVQWDCVCSPSVPVTMQPSPPLPASHGCALWNWMLRSPCLRRCNVVPTIPASSLLRREMCSALGWGREAKSETAW